MAYTVVSGAQSTTSVLSNQLAIDIGKRISLLEPDIQPLTLLSREAQTETTVATKFKWIEDEAKARFDTAAAAWTSSAKEGEVTHGVYFQQFDQVINTRTGEQFRVDAVNGNKLVVTRGIGASTETAMLEGDELYIIGTAQPEGDTSKTARSRTPSAVENYTQIFRTPYEITGTAENVDYMVMPTEWNRLQQNAGIEHAKDIELTLIIGRKSATTPGSQEDRTTGGVLSFITSNQTDAGGTLSEPEFNAFLAQVMRYGSTDKIGFLSAAATQALNKFPASKQITKNDETTYGMNVTQYSGPFGSLKIMYHKLLEGQKYGGYAIVVDMQEVAYRPLKNRDTKVRTNIQANDLDGRKDEYLTECGLRFGLQRTHGLISGITG